MLHVQAPAAMEDHPSPRTAGGLRRNGSGSGCVSYEQLRAMYGQDPAPRGPQGAGASGILGAPRRHSIDIPGKRSASSGDLGSRRAPDPSLDPSPYSGESSAPANALSSSNSQRPFHKSPSWGGEYDLPPRRPGAAKSRLGRKASSDTDIQPKGRPALGSRLESAALLPCISGVPDIRGPSPHRGVSPRASVDSLPHPESGGESGTACADQGVEIFILAGTQGDVQPVHASPRANQGQYFPADPLGEGAECIQQSASPSQRVGGNICWNPHVGISPLVSPNQRTQHTDESNLLNAKLRGLVLGDTHAVTSRQSYHQRHVSLDFGSPNFVVEDSQAPPGLPRDRMVSSLTSSVPRSGVHVQNGSVDMRPPLSPSPRASCFRSPGRSPNAVADRQAGGSVSFRSAYLKSQQEKSSPQSELQSSCNSTGKSPTPKPILKLKKDGLHHARSLGRRVRFNKAVDVIVYC